MIRCPTAAAPQGSRLGWRHATRGSWSTRGAVGSVPAWGEGGCWCWRWWRWGGCLTRSWRRRTVHACTAPVCMACVRRMQSCRRGTDASVRMDIQDISNIINMYNIYPSSYFLPVLSKKAIFAYSSLCCSSLLLLFTVCPQLRDGLGRVLERAVPQRWNLCGRHRSL